jgi:hypothetical protein
MRIRHFVSYGFVEFSQLESEITIRYRYEYGSFHTLGEEGGNVTTSTYRTYYFSISCLYCTFPSFLDT